MKLAYRPLLLLRLLRRSSGLAATDMDPSPSARARFADVKAAADVLLKGVSQPLHTRTSIQQGTSVRTWR